MLAMEKGQTDQLSTLLMCPFHLMEDMTREKIRLAKSRLMRLSRRGRGGTHFGPGDSEVKERARREISEASWKLGLQSPFGDACKCQRNNSSKHFFAK
jgi:hypothetical protein